VEAIGRTLSIPLVVVHAVSDGKFTAFRPYVDRLEMLAQLGAPAGGSAGS